MWFILAYLLIGVGIVVHMWVKDEYMVRHALIFYAIPLILFYPLFYLNHLYKWLRLNCK